MAELHKYEKGEGKEWNANDKIAWGAGPVHEDFKGLQRDLNEFASAIGFEKLDVDGFIGKHTAQAVAAIHAAALKKNPLLAGTPFPIPDTKEEVAEHAQFIRFWLSNVAKKALL